MYPIRLVFPIVSTVLSLAGTGAAQAQQRAAWFAEASFGPVVQDRRGNDLLRQAGFVVQTRAGLRLQRHLAAVVEFTHTSVSLNNDIVFPAQLRTVPCPEGETPPCGAERFLGPVKTVIAGAGVEASAGSESAQAFASLAPGMYWLYERAPGGRAASAGIGLAVGGSARLLDPIWAVLDLHYHRLFSDGPNPRWLVPVTLGIQIR